MVNAASAMPSTVTTLPMGSQTPSVSGAGQTLTQNNFLQLMTAQLENQDPLDPMTDTEFAAELAQFSTAQGVQSLQTSLTGMSGTLSGMQATGLVGQSVAVAGNSLSLGASGSVAGAVNLAAAATDVTVTVADSTGNAVATLDLGALPAGLQTFQWNGNASDGSREAAGNYTFSVSAQSGAGGSVTATPYAVQPVMAVTLNGKSGPMLELGTSLTPVALSAVQQIF
jgi:flagellar basal-body rod modification protein FlgD